MKSCISHSMPNRWRHETEHLRNDQIFVADVNHPINAKWLLVTKRDRVAQRVRVTEGLGLLKV